MLGEVVALLEHRGARDVMDAADDDPPRLAAGVRVDGGDGRVQSHARMVPCLRCRGTSRIVTASWPASSTPVPPRHEFLDGEKLDAIELRKNLREMAMLNRLPGGIGDSVRAVERLLGDQSEATVLDVGTGFG